MKSRNYTKLAAMGFLFLSLCLIPLFCLPGEAEAAKRKQVVVKGRHVNPAEVLRGSEKAIKKGHIKVIKVKPQSATPKITPVEDKKSRKELVEETKVPGTGNVKQHIEVHRSASDEKLEKLRTQLAPKEKGAKKQQVANEQPQKKAKPKPAAVNYNEERKKMLESLVKMTSADLDKVKKNIIDKTRKNTAIGEADKTKIVSEAARFYDTLKPMNPAQRKEYLKNFN